MNIYTYIYILIYTTRVGKDWYGEGEIGENIP
jgi:hypothetical protein